MSVSFISALTGDHAGTLPFPLESETTTLRCLLGRAAYFFRFIHGDAVILASHVLCGDVEVHFLKEAVSFNIYLHDEVSHQIWVAETTKADLLSHWAVANPIELMTKYTKNNEVKPQLKVGTFWKTWFQPRLEQGNAFQQKLAALIDNDVVSVGQIARRNILHEVNDQLRVDLYFALHIENYLSLKLLPIAGNFVENDTCSRSELERLILEINFD